MINDYPEKQQQQQHLFICTQIKLQFTIFY